MIRIGLRLAVAAMAVAGVSAAAPAAGPVIQIEDVSRFYRLYDASGGHPSADQLQHDYLDQGSDGLHTLAKEREVTGVRIADTLAKHPELYVNAKRCMAALPKVQARLAVSLGKLGQLYPEARFPPVTIAVGRGRPVAIGSPVGGVQIGLEALCAIDRLNPDVEARFVHVIAHEYVHVQQPSSVADKDDPTVLEGSLMEGSAEFVGELISGQVGYSQLAALTKGRETEIEAAFVADEDKKDLSKWLYNGEGTRAWPADLGYWVGYRITKAYYRHAPDKRRALAEILQATDAKAFLAKSGWRPGIRLD